MTDLILQIGASKLAVSLGLAGVAWIVQRRLGRPTLTHGLWLLPLAVLLVPPLVSVPAWPQAVGPVTPAAAMAVAHPEPMSSAGAILLGWLRDQGKEGLVWLWLLGTASVVGWTLVRTLRFQRSLFRASEAAPPAVQRVAAGIARNLGIRSVPTVYTANAHLSPMVWWAGGEARVLLPSCLLTDMDEVELRCILAHELAHVWRRDHLVRWLEWLACAAFWWNPAAWWARRRLRASEEVCCDALAVAAIGAEPRTYAGALLRVIDFMSKTPAPGPLTFASTIDRCGRASRLERRFRVIMTNRTSIQTPRWLRVALRCGAVCLLAVGLVYCTDQSNLTSVDPAFVPSDEEAVLHLDDRGDDPAADAPLPPQQVQHVMRMLIETIATEHALPADLAEALGDAGEAALSDRTPADMFLAVTPGDGAGNSKVVELDLAGLRSVTLETGLSPRQAAAVRAELARHLRVRSARSGFFAGMHIECTGAEGSSVSSSEGGVVARTMTCEEAKTSQGKLHVRTKR
ncbi:M56 family metallopeptidase [Candidatus Palauibacter sp.]|uniref:M56 family metallopeptidase n=1 Tax=Candidatus Palauibacter sp. TaxID=3101350 RepID=UPI003B01F9C2